MAQKYEKLVQEDLHTGTERVWTGAPGGGKLCSTQIGLHSFARGQRAYTATWAPGSIAAGSKASTTVSVPDAVTGDFVMASQTTLGDTGLTIHGHISASGTATVVIHNPTASAVSVSSGTVSVLVFPVYDGPATTGTVIVISDYQIGGEAEVLLYDSLLQLIGTQTTVNFTTTFTNVQPTSALHATANIPTNMNPLTTPSLAAGETVTIHLVPEGG